jgi:cytochrome c biogenesis protein
MLLLRRERVFARATGPGEDGGTVLSVASLIRGSGESGPRFRILSAALRAALDARAPKPEVASRDT